MHCLVFSKAGDRVVSSPTIVVAAGVDLLARVVHFLVVLQVVFAAECSVASFTQKCFCLGVNQNVPFQLELRSKLFITACKRLFMKQFPGPEECLQNVQRDSSKNANRILKEFTVSYVISLY